MMLQEKLSEIFETQFKPQLKKVEEERKKVMLYFILCLLCMPLPLIIVLFQFYIWGVAVPILLSTFFAVKAFIQLQKYRTAFKENVISKLIKLINPDYTYSANKYIAKEYFDESNFANYSYAIYKGDDYVSGKIGNLDFEFCEVEARINQSSKEANSAVYMGPFLCVDMKKEFAGRTIIKPDRTISTLEKWIDKLQRKNKKGKLITLDNPQFEEEFAVFGDSEEETRSILSASLMEAMLNIKSFYGEKVYFAFVGQRFYFGLHRDTSSFEPNISGEIISFKDFSSMYYMFSAAEIVLKAMTANSEK